MVAARPLPGTSSAKRARGARERRLRLMASLRSARPTRGDVGCAVAAPRAAEALTLVGPTSMRAAACRSAPDGVFNASAAPQAYLLTLGGERGRRATALLRAAGFAVHRMPPVVPRAAHARLLPPHFASQLGATWTNRSFSCMLTQREVYARIGRDHASTGHAFGYVFEDDIALHPSFAPAELGGVLHAAEQEAVASGAEVMYLGACRTYRKYGSWRVHVGRRPLGLSRCAVLCTHAYGVASAAAAGLYDRISLALGSNLAPAMDQNLFRYAAQSPRSRWPLCVSMESRVQPYVEDSRPDNSPSSFDTPRQRQISSGRPPASASLDQLAYNWQIYSIPAAFLTQVQPPDCCRGVFYQARGTYNSTIRQHPGPGRRRPRQRGQRGPRLRGGSTSTWTKGHFVHS